MKIALWANGKCIGTTNFTGSREQWDESSNAPHIARQVLKMMGYSPKQLVMSPETTSNPEGFKWVS